MNVNKKLDRFKQWAGERMGGEAKTNVSDDFKALEVEMGLRHEGERGSDSKTPLECLTYSRYGKVTEIYNGIYQGPLQA